MDEQDKTVPIHVEFEPLWAPRDVQQFLKLSGRTVDRLVAAGPACLVRPPLRGQGAGTGHCHRGHAESGGRGRLMLRMAHQRTQAVGET